MDIRELDSAAAAQRLETGDALFLDVRDPGSFEAGHIEGAVHVTDQTIGAFLEQADRSRTVIVYCYHGNMSQGGAAYLMENGFEDVYSLSGGFEEWRALHPPKS